MQHILIMTEFIEKSGVSIDNMEASYDETTGQLFFYGKEMEENENFERLVSVRLDEKRNSAIVKETIRHEYNFRPFWDQEYGKQTSYNVEVTINMTKFKAREQKLHVYTTTVFQTMKEDTLGRKNQSIIDFNSMADFLDEEHISKATSGGTYIPIEKTSYQIPEDYKITEGLSQIKEIPSQIVLRK